MNFTGTIVELMLKRNLAVRKEGAIIYKNAAILLFAEDPDMYIPSSWVRYIRYNGTEAKSGSEYNVIKDEEFR
jgi:ATP-dependent DNA helicase RecG